MDIKETALKVFNELDTVQLMRFLELLGDDNSIALGESEMIANDPYRKHYDSLAEILAEIGD